MFKIRWSGAGIKPGDVVNDWTVLGWQFSRGKYEKTHQWAFVGRCICGAVKAVDVSAAKRGMSSGCGCTRGDHSGEVLLRERCDAFGPGEVIEHLTILGWQFRVGDAWRVVCECVCGDVSVHRVTNIQNGTCKSCGCQSRKITHGLSYKRSKNPLYAAWSSMKQRCLRESHPSYRYYGGKGISVYSEWMEYMPFHNWAIANGWRPGLTIERMSSSGGYCPENCEFITKSENSRRANLGRRKKWG